MVRRRNGHNDVNIHILPFFFFFVDSYTLKMFLADIYGYESTVSKEVGRADTQKKGGKELENGL